MTSFDPGSAMISPVALPPLSVLDLVPIAAGSTAAQALRHSRDLVQLAEKLGYTRYWVAEHHNMPGIASAATSVVIGYLAEATSTIRVGAGGIMLPNHAPLIIAEQFGTLASLYPGRIDLGVGRAPGTDQRTAMALRRDPRAADGFKEDVRELQHWFAPASSGQPVQAVPGAGLQVPLWILGSSLHGAQLAAALGLPYAFASHFAPDALMSALALYRREFRPSAQLARPWAMAGLNVIAADSDADARRLFTSAQQAFTNMVRGRVGPLPPPIDDIEAYWSPMEKAHVQQMLSCSVVGGRETVAREVAEFAERTGVDELMVVTAIHDPALRQRSYEALAA